MHERASFVRALLCDSNAGRRVMQETKGDLDWPLPLACQGKEFTLYQVEAKGNFVLVHLLSGDDSASSLEEHQGHSHSPDASCRGNSFPWRAVASGLSSLSRFLSSR